MNKPRYKHDCEKCRFLGQFQEFDVYHCANEIFSSDIGGSIIARYDDEGSCYISCPVRHANPKMDYFKFALDILKNESES